MIQKSCVTLFQFLSLKKSVCIQWLKQQGKYKRFKKGVWYNKQYWYINTVTNNNKSDDNATTSTATTNTTTITTTTDNSNNNINNVSNNIIMIRIPIIIKMKNGCALKNIKGSYIYYSLHYLFS